MSKMYIGDGVYVEHDGWNVTLTTSNGMATTNTIVLEPEVMKSLLDYLVAKVPLDYTERIDSNDLGQLKR